MIRSLGLVCALGLTLGLPACSSSKSSGGNSSTFSSGLPGSEQLGSLSASDATRLCNELTSYSANLAKSETTDACRLTGFFTAAASAAFGTTVTSADLQKTCSDAEQQCTQRGTSNADAGTTTCTKPSSSCTATVSELETCINDTGTFVNKAYSNIPECSSLTTENVKLSTDGGLFGATTEPPSCKTLDQECPDAFNTSVMSGSPATP